MDMTALQRMLDAGRDSALLRFSLGKGLLDAGEPAEAAAHLQRCVAQDPAYSAGWKTAGQGVAGRRRCRCGGTGMAGRHCRGAAQR